MASNMTTDIFKHRYVGQSWKKRDWEALDLHQAEGQTQGDVTYFNGTYWVRLGAGTSGQYLKTQGAGANPVWATVTGGTAHAILDGSTHNDSVADAVTRGSIIYGNATPKWDELVLGASGRYLRSNGTDLAYSTIQAADLPTGIDAAKIADGSVSNAEFQYLDGVTSAIQTQLAGKAATTRKLDDFGSPDDNTDLNASTSAHGLCPKLDNDVTHFLNGQGGWTASGFDFFDKVRNLIPWISLDGYTQTKDGTSETYINGATVKLLAQGGEDNDCQVRSTGTWYVLTTAGKKVTVEFPIMHALLAGSRTIWAYMTKSATCPPSDTVTHLGFKIVNNDIFASNADGTTQKTTDTGVNLGIGNMLVLLKFVFDPGTDCKFYVDNVLKATHTDNLPTTYVEYYLSLTIRQETATIRSVDFGRIAIEQEI